MKCLVDRNSAVIISRLLKTESSVSGKNVIDAQRSRDWDLDYMQVPGRNADGKFITQKVGAFS